MKSDYEPREAAFGQNELLITVTNLIAKTRPGDAERFAKHGIISVRGRSETSNFSWTPDAKTNPVQIAIQNS